jgi:hypothetical protein
MYRRVEGHERTSDIARSRDASPVESYALSPVDYSDSTSLDQPQDVSLQSHGRGAIETLDGLSKMSTLPKTRREPQWYQIPPMGSNLKAIPGGQDFWLVFLG